MWTQRADLHPLTVWPGAGAAIGVVTECVNVHAAFSVGIVACDVP